MRKIFPITLLALCLSIQGGIVRAQGGDMIINHAAVHRLDHGNEKQLVDALEKIRQNRIDDATAELKQLVNANPKFRLAQLIYADMLLAHSRSINGFGNFPSANYEKIAAFRDEAFARWQHYLHPPPEDHRHIPGLLVKLSPHQSHVIVVDTSQSRLYLFENRKGIPVLVDDFYATIGKNGANKDAEGDGKTPVGVYFVTGFIKPDELPDLYGDGAFPIDYPNIWDQRHGRTGYGIWLHGTPSYTYSRPPRDSNGCIIVSNRDLKTIAPYMQSGITPVIIADHVQWLSQDEWRNRQSYFNKFVDQWRKDWESRNTDLYLSHYSSSYKGLGKDYKSWVNYKKRVNSAKKYIQVDITDKSMFLYPGEKGLLVVTFRQDYKSDKVERKFVKRQYWRRQQDGTWRIVYEGSVS